MFINIPSKLAVSSVAGYIKGKSASHEARHFLKKARNYAGQSLWARGFFVDTVGRDMEVIRMGNSVQVAKRLSPGTKVLDGQPSRGRNVKDASNDVRKWVGDINLMK